jgi:hypothetical protein
MVSDQPYTESVISQLEVSDLEGKVYVTIGRKLSAILQEKINVPELLFGDGLLQQLYSGRASTVNYERMRSCVDLMAHKNPTMSILENGAGTGGATAAVLQAPHNTRSMLTRISRLDFSKRRRFGLKIRRVGWPSAP